MHLNWLRLRLRKKKKKEKKLYSSIKEDFRAAFYEKLWGKEKLVSSKIEFDKFSKSIF